MTGNVATGSPVFSRHEIFQSNVLTQGIPLPDGFIHCSATSPPYWGLRDYGVEGQIGNEKLHDCEGKGCGECYVCHIVGVFRHVWRVLRDDGTAWLNIGDSYSGGGRGNYDVKSSNKGNAASRGLGRPSVDGLKPKDLCMIPWRVAMGLQRDGWYIRQYAPWVKRSAMPESVEDRPGTATEAFFLLTKSPQYFYDHEAVKIPARYGANGSSFVRGKTIRDGQSQLERTGDGNRNRRSSDWWIESIQLIAGEDQYGMVPGEDGMPIGFDVANTGFKGAHFACWPPKLVSPCLKASTSEKGCCPTCGAPWTRIVESERVPTRPANDSKVAGLNGNVIGNRDPQRHQTTKRTVGWEQGCDCPKAEPVRCRVLDPFSGAASTGIACLDLDLEYYGSELNPEYIAMSLRRLEGHKQYLRTGVKPKEVEPEPDQFSLFGAVA